MPGLGTAASIAREQERQLVAIPVSSSAAAAEVDQQNPPVAPPPLLRAKIEPPQLRSSTITRARLIHALESAIEHRVTLLVADAGYGKTTLLTDFSTRSSVRCLWYKLDSTDQDWVTLVNYVVAAAREIDPVFGARTLHLLSSDLTSMAPRDAVLSSLLGELQAMGEARTVLILDDFHEVDESGEACEVITRLIRDAPSSFRFVLSSRRRPPLLLARLAGLGELSEMRTDDLRFSLEETEQLFAEGYGRPLDRDIVEEIDGRTRGWAATLQLVTSSIRGRPDAAVRSLARSISGGEGPLYDFLAEEVLSCLSPELQDLLVRAALLQEIVPVYVMALFGGEAALLSETDAQRLIEEADGLAILSRSSRTSEVRQFHPLFREFLLRQATQRFAADEIRAMHARVARVAIASDPLLASHHFIEAGESGEAMRCLATSAMLTMGSGRWGTASELISRLHDVPADPVVAAIQARRLLEEGDVVAAATLLDGIDVSTAPPAARAVFRHTRLSLGWRSRDSEALFATLREIEEDTETPPLLREIAQVFVDASPLSPNPVAFPALSQRLQRMAERQARAGHTYYAAISLHNAAIAELNAGRFREAIRVGHAALEQFDRAEFAAPDRLSTHPVLAACWLELGRPGDAEEEIRIALASGKEEGDVHASCANSLAIIGERERSTRLLLSAEALERQGRLDLQGSTLVQLTRAFLQTSVHPTAALQLLASIRGDSPLDLGFNLEQHSLTALSHLMADDLASAAQACEVGLDDARGRNGVRSEVRLELVFAMAKQDAGMLRAALQHAGSVGDMALLQVADAVGRHLDLLGVVPAELADSIRNWRSRWLPVLRTQLGRGNVPSAHIAARLLDEYGALEDVPRLRAYEKTYLKRRAIGLGRALARRVSSQLQIKDLGRVMLHVGDRSVPLSSMRRKPASLLMYLVTRPNFTATREQVIDALWPEADPAAGLNSLNQTLYFLRREIDPWYEDDISADYVAYEGELLWLDPALVTVQSAAFLSEARTLIGDLSNAIDALGFMEGYTANFSPEFEYEEWAMSWRSRVHASYLDFAHGAIDSLIAAGDVKGARDVASRALRTDPSASDIEQKLIWLYARLGAMSAAQAQYQHFAAQYRADGLDPPALAALTNRERPI